MVKDFGLKPEKLTHEDLLVASGSAHRNHRKSSPEIDKNLSRNLPT